MRYLRRSLYIPRTRLWRLSGLPANRRGPSAVLLRTGSIRLVSSGTIVAICNGAGTILRKRTLGAGVVLIPPPPENKKSVNDQQPLKICAAQSKAGQRHLPLYFKGFVDSSLSSRIDFAQHQTPNPRHSPVGSGTSSVHHSRRPVRRRCSDLQDRTATRKCGRVGPAEAVGPT